jgi:integrase
MDRFRVRSSGDIQVFSPEEVWALVRSAASDADAAIFLTAAFTGLRRGELLALRWRDIDFAGSTIRVRASYAAGRLTTPKSGKVRAVPMAPDVGRRWRGSAIGRSSRAMTTSYSLARSGCHWTETRSAAATAMRWPGLDCGHCASTT